MPIAKWKYYRKQSFWVLYTYSSFFTELHYVFLKEFDGKYHMRYDFGLFQYFVSLRVTVRLSPSIVLMFLPKEQANKSKIRQVLSFSYSLINWK